MILFLIFLLLTLPALGQVGELTRAVRADPANPFLRYNLALALERDGRLVEALEQARVAAQRIPSETATLTWTRRSQSPFRILELEPADLFRCRVLTLTGRLLAATGSVEQGLDQLHLAVEAAPASELTPFRELARAAAAAGRPGLAAHYYQYFLESALRFTGVQADLALWGPGQLPTGGSDLTYRVDPQGRVTTQEGQSLGLVLPPESYGLTVDFQGLVRVDRSRELPLAVGRLAVPEGSRLLSHHRYTERELPEVWRELAELDARAADLVCESPFLDVASRRRALREVPASLQWFGDVRQGNLDLESFAAGGGSGLLESAERHYLRALELEPEADLSYFNLAAVHFLQRRDEQGLADLALLLERKPDRRRPRRYRLQALLARGQLERALQEAAAYTAGHPDDPYPRFAAAEVLAFQGRNRSALQAVDQLLERTPAVLEARYLRVFLLAREGRLKEQLAELEALLVDDPFPFRAQRLLADILSRMGQEDRARELYRAYLDSSAALYYEPAEYARVQAENF